MFPKLPGRKLKVLPTHFFDLNYIEDTFSTGSRALRGRWKAFLLLFTWPELGQNLDSFKDKPTSQIRKGLSTKWKHQANVNLVTKNICRLRSHLNLAILIRN